MCIEFTLCERDNTNDLSLSVRPHFWHVRQPFSVYMLCRAVCACKLKNVFRCCVHVCNCIGSHMIRVSVCAYSGQCTTHSLHWLYVCMRVLSAVFGASATFCQTVWNLLNTLLRRIQLKHTKHVRSCRFGAFRENCVCFFRFVGSITRSLLFAHRFLSHSLSLSPYTLLFCPFRHVLFIGLRLCFDCNSPSHFHYSTDALHFVLSL